MAGPGSIPLHMKPSANLYGLSITSSNSAYSTERYAKHVRAKRIALRRS